MKYVLDDESQVTYYEYIHYCFSGDFALEEDTPYIELESKEESVIASVHKVALSYKDVEVHFFVGGTKTKIKAGSFSIVDQAALGMVKKLNQELNEVLLTFVKDEM